MAYYNYMLQIAEHDARCDAAMIVDKHITLSYLEMANCHKAIFDTPSIQADETKWKQHLRDVVRAVEHLCGGVMLLLQVLYVLLSPFDNAQSDFLSRIAEVRPNTASIAKHGRRRRSCGICRCSASW